MYESPGKEVCGAPHHTTSNFKATKQDLPMAGNESQNELITRVQVAARQYLNDLITFEELQRIIDEVEHEATIRGLYDHGTRI